MAILDSSSILDLIFSQNCDHVCDIRYVSPLGLSDHVTIQFCIRSSLGATMEDAEPNLVRRLWDKADHSALLAYADCINFCCDDSSVDRCWHVIRDKLFEISNKFAPKFL
ncbi:hypothetical protein GJ496_011156 [Pomphorhynchus laevis]|nr:hypothetical protein GJ496_011156 [Pomphorhynchus laevis]